jgi:hypothetical protein
VAQCGGAVAAPDADLRHEQNHLSEKFSGEVTVGVLDA